MTQAGYNPNGPNEWLEAIHSQDISGLARQCPKCGTVAHYEIKGRKAQWVECPICDFGFEVKKYRRGERPTPNKTGGDNG